MIFSKRRGLSEELAEGKDFNGVVLKLMNFLVRFRATDEKTISESSFLFQIHSVFMRVAFRR